MPGRNTLPLAAACVSALKPWRNQDTQEHAKFIYDLYDRSFVWRDVQHMPSTRTGPRRHAMDFTRLDNLQR